jgi:hypothetical protein
MPPSVDNTTKKKSVMKRINASITANPSCVFTYCISSCAWTVGLRAAACSIDWKISWRIWSPVLNASAPMVVIRVRNNHAIPPLIAPKRAPMLTLTGTSDCRRRYSATLKAPPAIIPNPKRLKTASRKPHKRAARNASDQSILSERIGWLDCTDSVAGSELPESSLLSTSSTGSEEGTRICGAPQFWQKRMPSSTAEPHR